MSRLVVISNRTVNPHESRSGGLAVALWSALKKSGGMWIGWDGNVCRNDNPELKKCQADGVEFYTTEFTEFEYDNSYIGYANSVLWPVFHNRIDLAKYDPEYKSCYEKTIKRMASFCSKEIMQDDVIWVHDYQMIPFGMELRAQRMQNSIGFFLHIPFPPEELMRSIPEHRWLITSLFSYDLIGFQTENDMRKFHNYIINYTDVDVFGDKCYLYKGRKFRVGVFPIGIDPEEIRNTLDTERSRELEKKFIRENPREMIVGVDRLDYSKGILHRIHSISKFFSMYPEKKRAVSLLQIAAPSREKVVAYEELSECMDCLCGKINGELGDLHWSPVSYIHRNIAREDLPVIYRVSKVGLVTPLCDGMNLVAKEYIASQDPGNPGVLILSEFAGAAQQFTDALLVNPFDINATAHMIARALAMPLQERQLRYQSLMRCVVHNDVHWWCDAFLSSLKEREVRLVG